jgi:hypothetical protein
VDEAEKTALLQGWKIGSFPLAGRFTEARFLPSELRECTMKETFPKKKSGGATSAAPL